jgi:hypothetical protein
LMRGNIRARVHPCRCCGCATWIFTKTIAGSRACLVIRRRRYCRFVGGLGVMAFTFHTAQSGSTRVVNGRARSVVFRYLISISTRPTRTAARRLTKSLPSFPTNCARCNVAPASHKSFKARTSVHGVEPDLYRPVSVYLRRETRGRPSDLCHKQV